MLMDLFFLWSRQHDGCQQRPSLSPDDHVPGSHQGLLAPANNIRSCRDESHETPHTSQVFCWSLFTYPGWLLSIRRLHYSSRRFTWSGVSRRRDPETVWLQSLSGESDPLCSVGNLQRLFVPRAHTTRSGSRSSLSEISVLEQVRGGDPVVCTIFTCHRLHCDSRGAREAEVWEGSKEWRSGQHRPHVRGLCGCSEWGRREWRVLSDVPVQGQQSASEGRTHRGRSGLCAAPFAGHPALEAQEAEEAAGQHLHAWHSRDTVNRKQSSEAGRSAR